MKKSVRKIIILNKIVFLHFHKFTLKYLFHINETRIALVTTGKDLANSFRLGLENLREYRVKRFHGRDNQLGQSNVG